MQRKVPYPTILKTLTKLITTQNIKFKKIKQEGQNVVKIKNKITKKIIKERKNS